MGQKWQGCCLALPCPTGDQRFSGRLRSSQPAVIRSALCHQLDTDISAIPEGHWGKTQQSNMENALGANYDQVQKLQAAKAYIEEV